MIPYSGPIVTKEEARAAGLKYFFTSVPCRDGHISQRYARCGHCLVCCREHARQRYRDDPENARAKMRAYRKANPDIMKALDHRKYVKLKDTILQDRRAYYQSNVAKVLTYKRSYRKLNADKIRTWNRNRKARKRAAAGTHTTEDIADIRRMQRDRCAMPECRCKLRGGGELDHIIALSKGGTNDRRNLQWLCESCNSRKRAKDPIDFARELGRLL